MLNPLVSVILTSYNQPELLKRAFDSLVMQTYKNIEIIIVDDCSTDKENKRLIDDFIFHSDGNVKAIYQKKNIGIPANKNSGFKLAKGDFITYLDGDDTYYKNKIETEIKTFELHPDVDIVYSNFDIKEVGGKILSVWSSAKTPPQGFIFEDIILNNFPDCHTQRVELFRKNVLYDLNFYDENFSVYHDLDFMIRYSLKYKTCYNDYVGSSYYKNPQSIVSNTKGIQLIEQREKVYFKYLGAIKEHEIEKEFRKYLDNLETEKLYYLENFEYTRIFKAYLRQPFKIMKFAKLISYLYKKV